MVTWVTFSACLCRASSGRPAAIRCLSTVRMPPYASSVPHKRKPGVSIQGQQSRGLGSGSEQQGREWRKDGDGEAEEERGGRGEETETEVREERERKRRGMRGRKGREGREEREGGTRPTQT
eukprot:703516-Rhodomonas_salina.2